MKSILVEPDILLLPDPLFGTMLIFPQVPFIEYSVKFSIESSRAWIEEKRPPLRLYAVRAFLNLGEAFLPSQTALHQSHEWLQDGRNHRTKNSDHLI